MNLFGIPSSCGSTPEPFHLGGSSTNPKLLKYIYPQLILECCLQVDYQQDGVPLENSCSQKHSKLSHLIDKERDKHMQGWY